MVTKQESEAGQNLRQYSYDRSRLTTGCRRLEAPRGTLICSFACHLPVCTFLSFLNYLSGLAALNPIIQQLHCTAISGLSTKVHRVPSISLLHFAMHSPGSSIPVISGNTASIMLTRSRADLKTPSLELLGAGDEWLYPPGLQAYQLLRLGFYNCSCTSRDRRSPSGETPDSPRRACRRKATPCRTCWMT